LYAPTEISDVERGSKHYKGSGGGGGGTPEVSGLTSPAAQRMRVSLKKGGLPLIFRLMTLACSCAAFSLIASTGSKTGEVNGINISGRKFRHYRTLNYGLASNAILFAYSLFMCVVDIMRYAGAFEPTVVSRQVMSFLAQWLDFGLVFLQFGAATAIAGLRGGFSDLSLVDYCSVSQVFCRKLVASTVFSYVAWLFLAPSLYINIISNEEGPW
jgi:hypothetical protein